MAHRSSWFSFKIVRQPEGSPPLVGWMYLLCFALISSVGGLSAIGIKQLLLPYQVRTLDPASALFSFALVSSAGALAGLIASPLVGALSDLTTWDLGRRRSWILLGTACALMGLLVMPLASSIWMLLVGQVITQIGVDSLLAVTSALIPDQISPRQRHLAASINGMAPVVGGLIGVLAITSFTDTTILWQPYLLLAGLTLGCVGCFLLVLRETPLPREQVPAFHLLDFLHSFVRPLTHRNFVWTLLSRICAYLAFTLVGAFLSTYFLTTLFGGDERLLAERLAAGQLAQFQGISISAVLLAAIVVGRWSGQVQRLKPFLLAGACLMTWGVLVLVFLPERSLLPLAAGLFGAGFGSFVAGDMALSIQVLPHAGERGKDLGLMHTAVFIALILSPILGSFLLTHTHGHFGWVFGVAAAASVLSAVFIMPIKHIR